MESATEPSPDGTPGLLPSPRSGASPLDDRRWTGDRLLLAAGWCALVVVHLAASWRTTGPSVVYDESGYLGTARLFAGGSRWEMPLSPGYAIGYPLVVAPLMVVLDTAESQWRAVVGLNAVLLASVFPLLAAVLRRLLDLPLRRALAPAAVGALAPAVLAAGPSALAENLALPLVLVTVLAAWAVTRDGTATGLSRSSRLAAYGLGPTAAALHLTHARFVGVAAAALALLVVGAALGRVRARVAAVNVASLVALGLAGRLLSRRVRSARWDRTETPAGGLDDWLDLVSTPAGIGEVVLTTLGQVWYLAVGSAAVGVVGVVALVRVVAGRGTAAAGAGGAARRLVGGFVLASAVALFAASVVFFAQNQLRPDHWVYGRHNDSFVPLWLGVGVAVLVGRPLRQRLIALAVGAVTIAVTGVAVAVARDPSTLEPGFSPFAVPAVYRFVGDHPDATFWRGTLGGLAAAGALAAAVTLTARRPRRGRTTGAGVVAAALVVPVLVAAWGVHHGSATVTATVRYQETIDARWTVPGEIRRLGIDQLDIEAKTARSLPTLLYPFHLPEVDVRVYEDAAGEEPQGPYVVARLDDPARPRAGDRVALLDQGGFYWLMDAEEGLAVWVRPGPEQDRLAADDLLLPVGFPTALPPAARRGSVTLVDTLEDPVVVAAGGRFTVAVTGRHQGTTSPWPDADSYGLGARVRVQTRVTPLDADGLPGAPSGGELPRWIRPGDAFATEVTVVAVGEMLQPLPPGRYRVELGIAQPGADWFTPGGDGAAFDLEVRAGG